MRSALSCRKIDLIINSIQLTNPVHFNNKKTVSDTLLRWPNMSNMRGLRDRDKMGSKKS